MCLMRVQILSYRRPIESLSTALQLSAFSLNSLVKRGGEQPRTASDPHRIRIRAAPDLWRRSRSLAPLQISGAAPDLWRRSRAAEAAASTARLGLRGNLSRIPYRETCRETIEKPAEKPVEKPIEKPAEKPVEKPVEKPIEKLTEKAVEEADRWPPLRLARPPP